jgi:hypothetical protein
MTEHPHGWPQGENSPASRQLPRMAGTLSGNITMIPKKGLEFSRSTSFDSWLRLGRQLSALSTSSAWCLGDWLLYGIANYEGRYREAIEQTSLDYQTLRNYAWVANRFSLSRRREKLSFGHHTEVAALPTPEQDFWLRKAEELGWSVKRLRQEVRCSIKERSSCEDGQPERPLDEGQSELQVVKLQVDVSPEQLEVCRAAASSAGLSLAEWVALTLEDAARQVLDQLTASRRYAAIGSAIGSSRDLARRLTGLVYPSSTFSFLLNDSDDASKADIASIVVQDGELDGFRFAGPDEIGSLVNPPLARL